MATKRLADIGRIGGSWIAPALGLSEYASPLDAYLRITGEVVDQKEGDAIDRGNFLEPALRNWHAKKLGLNPEGITQVGTQAHPQHPWATFTPDGIAHPVMGGQILAEYKSPGEATMAKYGEPGTDQLPRDVGVQVHWGLFVTDLPQAQVAALIGGELRLYNVQQDKDLEREFFERADHFMKHHVAKKIPPSPTASERDTAWVKSRWPRSDAGKKRTWSELTNEERRLLATCFELNQGRKQAEKQETELSNAVKESILQDCVCIEGDADSPFKRLDWKSNSTVGPAWKQVAEELMTIIRAAGPSLLGLPVDEALQNVVKANTGEPPRVFKFYPKKGE